jgi:hypothetical protein
MEQEHEQEEASTEMSSSTEKNEELYAEDQMRYLWLKFGHQKDLSDIDTATNKEN